jgi:hypothetical protein
MHEYELEGDDDKILVVVAEDWVEVGVMTIVASDGWEDGGDPLTGEESVGLTTIIRWR